MTMTQVLGYAYPPSDPDVLNHFAVVEHTAPGGLDLAQALPLDRRDLAVTKGKAHFLWFLAAVFEGANRELSQRSGPPFTKRAALAQWWDEKLNQDPEKGFLWRQNFYNACIKML